MASVLVTLQSHFVRGPDGHVYSRDPLVGYDFWRRYLAVFDRVGVVARVAESRTIDPQFPRADGEAVSFVELPEYRGPWQYLKLRSQLKAQLAQAIEQYDHYVLRVPCAIGSLTWKQLKAQGKPYGIEALGDPWEALAPGMVRSIARPIARRTSTNELKAQCATAAAVGYVTRESLQRRYPAKAGALATWFTTLTLPDNSMVAAPRSDFSGASKLLFAGSLNGLHKAPDVLLRAVAECGRSDVTLEIVGDGQNKAELTALANYLGIKERVTFAGELPVGQSLQPKLDAADLFVLPSRQEGLPGPMLEAMARGLPCIGTDVGGFSRDS